MGITSDLGIDRSGPRTQRLSGNAAAWIFGCYLHFIPISFNPQEHRSTRARFYWYTAAMSKRTSPLLAFVDQDRRTVPGA